MFEKNLVIQSKTQENTDKNVEKDRRLELIKENHRFAIAAYELENFLVNTEDISIKEDELKKQLDCMPEKIRLRFENAIKNYRSRVTEMQKYVGEIEALIESHCNIGMPMTKAKEGVAKIMFRSLVGQGFFEPLGEIKLEIKEGYFILIFENEKDYQKARHNKKGVEDKEVEETGGCYINSSYLRMFKDRYYGPVLLVRNDQKDVENIIKHERQHYINRDILNNFSLTENGPDQKTESESNQAKIEGFRNIKNEIISYIRSTQTADYKFSFKNTLHQNIYKHLFDCLNTEDRIAVDNVIGSIDEFLKNKKTAMQLKNDHWCAIMTYQLAHVPLLKFPHWLKALDDYYLKRYEILEQFGRVGIDESDFRWSRNKWKNDVFEMTYPVKYQNYVKNNSEVGRTLSDKIDELEIKAINVVFDQKMTFEQMEVALSEIKTKYDELNKDFSLLCDPIKKNGILAPGSDIPESYGYGEYNSNPEKDGSEFLLNAQRQILSAIDSYSQDEIDKISRYHCLGENKDDSEAAEKKLICHLKKIIHSLNNSRACNVSFCKEETFPESFNVYLDFLVSPAENKSGTKGGIIEVFAHGSGFKF